jgi:hypothetical protein
MKDLIRNILKEETNSVDTKKINLIKDFINDYFTGYEYFDRVEIEIGTFTLFDRKIIPDIIISIYFSDYDIADDYDPDDLLDEIDFIMSLLFPNDNKGRSTGVFSLYVESSASNNF